MILTLPIPPSVNAIYRNVPGVGRVKTKIYKQWRAAADVYYYSQRHKLKPVTGPYELAIRIPMSMRGDADNRIKAVSDYLVILALTPDDRNCVKFSIERSDTVTECEVQITGRE